MKLMRDHAVRLVCLFTLSGIAQLKSAPAQLAPGENLIVEGIPPIPVGIAERASRYTESRQAVAYSWHPTRREIDRKSVV